MIRTLAGHAMEEGPGGLACRYCGKTWMWLLDHKDQWVVGATGISHIDPTNEFEVSQLNGEIDRIWSMGYGA